MMVFGLVRGRRIAGLVFLLLWCGVLVVCGVLGFAGVVVVLARISWRVTVTSSSDELVEVLVEVPSNRRCWLKGLSAVTSVLAGVTAASVCSGCWSLLWKLHPRSVRLAWGAPVPGGLGEEALHATPCGRSGRAL